MKQKETKLVPEDLEAIILGALMQDKEAIYTISSILKADHFGHLNNRLTYEAIMALHHRGSAIDLITVAQELKDMGKLKAVGGPNFLINHANRVASGANIEHHAYIVLQYYMRREALQLGSTITSLALTNEEDIHNTLDVAEVMLEDIKGTTAGAKQQTNQDIAEGLMETIERNRTTGRLGRPIFGIKELDDFIEGASDEDVIIVAARPAMGKSSLFNTAVKYHVENNIPALFWSCEMTNKTTMARALAACTGIPYYKIMKADFNGNEEQIFHYWLDRIIKAPVFFEQTAGINALDFKSKVVTLQKKHGITAAFIDRIGLLNDMPGTSNDNKSNRVGATTKIFRQMAINLGIPIIAINQLSRKVEERALKIPMLSDLRESGNIEQDATKVLLVYRPEYYDILLDDEGESTIGKAFFIVAKNTNGKTGTVKTGFTGDCMYFHSEEENNFNNPF